ncbi:MAG: hypothetical protein H7Z16_05925 [Pyrinomonadaceae bacterium]|nr:hypothetical protein [Pyrinomonadaceae bacterium]
MAEPLPRRLVGYGAYNLCFDKLLGRRQNAAGLDFFKTIRQELKLGKINLVRVICFRHSRKEGLPANRAIPLFAKTPTTPSQIVVNPAFLKNLEDLVDSAQQSNFWVQVSIFHFHAIATPDGNPGSLKPEVPELLPPVLVPNRAASKCQRLKTFFHPTPAVPAQLARQKQLTAAIVGRLKGRPKVIYEIGNELRMEGSTCVKDDNCQLAAWMNVIKAEILRVDPTAHVGTSTGKNGVGVGDNEERIFSTCPAKLVPTYFDFHSGEWVSDDLRVLRIKAAAQRAKTYLGITTVPPLIIDDDGVHDVNRTRANIIEWSTAAFAEGLHYATKQTYPNGGTDDGAILDFNRPVIKALNDAARDTAFP